LAKYPSQAASTKKKKHRKAGCGFWAWTTEAKVAFDQTGAEQHNASYKIADAIRTKAEKRLLTFVRVVAFLERMGNGLGRLVLIWATVVVGFSKDLGYHFWFLAGFVILESFRYSFIWKPLP
jgi:hypothetical protein